MFLSARIPYPYSVASVQLGLHCQRGGTQQACFISCLQVMPTSLNWTCKFLWRIHWHITPMLCYQPRVLFPDFLLSQSNPPAARQLVWRQEHPPLALILMLMKLYSAVISSCCARAAASAMQLPALASTVPLPVFHRDLPKSNLAIGHNAVHAGQFSFQHVLQAAFAQVEPSWLNGDLGFWNSTLSLRHLRPTNGMW
jgi:hypothetical protein